MEGKEKEHVVGSPATKPEGTASLADKGKQDGADASPATPEVKPACVSMDGKEKEEVAGSSATKPKGTASLADKGKQDGADASPATPEVKPACVSMDGKEKEDVAGSSATKPKGTASPADKGKQDGDDSSPTIPEVKRASSLGAGSWASRSAVISSLREVSLGEASAISVSGADDEARIADPNAPLYLEYFPETDDKCCSPHQLGGLETPGTSAMVSEAATPDGAATPVASGSLHGSSSSSSSLDTDESHGNRGRKKLRRKKRHRHDPHYERATVNTRMNILRNPFHACVGQPFKGEGKASADPKTPGTDHVVAYVTSTSVDARQISLSMIATQKIAQQDIDLVKEHATLNGLLSNLVECLKLDHELHIKSKGNDQAVRRLNGIIKPPTKRREISFDIPETNPTNAATSPELGSEAEAWEIHGAESSLRRQRGRVKFHEPLMPCPQPHLLKGASASPVSDIEVGQDRSSGDDDTHPGSPAALGTSEDLKASGKQPSDDPIAVEPVHEPPLIFFSSSLTESSERQQLAGPFSKGSSGYAGDSETESFTDVRGCLEAAFGAGSFREDYGLTLRSPMPNRRNMYSDSSTADGEGGQELGCWHDLFQPIKMVSKYTQTDCWNEPSMESSTRDPPHSPPTPRLKTTTNSVQRACPLQKALRHMLDSSEASSTEELEKIFSAYSTSSVHAGDDESGRVKGVLHDRNFSGTSSSGSSGKSGQESARIAQPSTFDGGTINSTADGPNTAGVPADNEDALQTGH